MTDQPRQRITIDAPDSPTILAARHLDATEGRVQVGSTVDSAARAAITRVLDYVAKAHNSPATADLPASTAPAAAAHPIVRGRCPACRGESLFLGSGGHVTCSRLDCPDPTAADDQLHHTDPTESRPRLVAPGVSNPQTGTGLASGTNWTTAGPGRSAGQNLAFTSAPAEHCGHLKPDFLGGTPTECVLRPGHSGSHADHNGTRWWKTTEQALEDQDTAPAATEATDTPAVPATRARYAQAVARIESSGPRPAGAALSSGPPCIPDHGAAVYCPGCAHNEETEPTPDQVATEATDSDTITNPAWLREQYTSAMLHVVEPFRILVTPELFRIVNEMATAVLAVRDRHLLQLRQRLTLADADLDRYEEHVVGDLNEANIGLARQAARAEQQRDQLAVTLREVLDAFEAYWARASYCGPGQTAVQPEHFQGWRAVLYAPAEA